MNGKSCYFVLPLVMQGIGNVNNLCEAGRREEPRVAGSRVTTWAVVLIRHAFKPAINSLPTIREIPPRLLPHSYPAWQFIDVRLPLGRKKMEIVQIFLLFSAVYVLYGQRQLLFENESHFICTYITCEWIALQDHTLTDRYCVESSLCVLGGRGCVLTWMHSSYQSTYSNNELLPCKNLTAMNSVWK